MARYRAMARFGTMMQKTGQLFGTALLALAGCAGEPGASGGAAQDKSLSDAAPAITAKFPRVSGESLNKRRFELPEQLDAPYNILLVAFYQRQQSDIDTWLPAARAIATDHANVEYYELPTIDTGWTLVQGWVDNGMRSGIPAFAARERTITVYTDTKKFRASAGFDDPNRIWAGLVDRSGIIHWSARGRATPELLKSLRDKVDQLASPGAIPLNGRRTIE